MKELVSFHMDVPYPASFERLRKIGRKEVGYSFECVLCGCFRCLLVNLTLFPWLWHKTSAGWGRGRGLWELRPLHT